MIPRQITSSQFVQALEKAGVVQRGDMIRRLVIDARASDLLVMYVERVGDERLLDVACTLDGIEIRGAPAGQGENKDGLPAYPGALEIPIRQRAPAEVRDRLLSGPLPAGLATEVAENLAPGST